MRQPPAAPEPLYFRIYGDYPGTGPVFYSRAECPWLPEVERHAGAIRRELEAFLARGRDGLTASYVPDDVVVRGWRSINFMTYRHWYRANCGRFPRRSRSSARSLISPRRS